MKEMKDRHPVWRHVLFVGTNVLLLFALLYLWHVLFLGGSWGGSWANPLLFSVTANAVFMPIHIRKFGPVWTTPPYGPLYRVWAAAYGWACRVRGREANAREG